MCKRITRTAFTHTHIFAKNATCWGRARKLYSIIPDPYATYKMASRKTPQFYALKTERWLAMASEKTTPTPHFRRPKTERADDDTNKEKYPTLSVRILGGIFF